ncbi:MAG: lipopolysaccharide kinase InaA family protein [Verrucomicrobiota bacterium]
MLATAKLICAPDWQAILRTESVASIYALATGTVVKRGQTTEVRRVEICGRTVFIKKYWSNSFGQLWSGALRGTFFGKSKARREYENLHRLREWGFDAPAPVAYGEERRAGWMVRSCLISEAIPNAVSLDEYRQLPYELADIVRRLHARGFVHHDLYWRNIILSGNRFFLLDAHKGGPGDIAQDLATLDAAAPFFFRRTERLRFFLRYRQHESLTTEDKQLIARLLALAAPQRDRQLKRIREARR